MDLYAATDLETPYRLPFDQAMQVLKTGKIDKEMGLMGWGSNYTFLVSVQCDETSLLAVYKPRKGERPLWDFPDGTLCQRETATFLTSEALGWRLVPPTVMHEGTRGEGSLQLFLMHDPEQHFFTFSEQEIPQLKKLSVFDAVVNNADRKGGHCLLDSDRRLWGIDHGLTFHTVNKLRTVIWDYAGQPIDDDLLADLEKLCARLDDEEDSYTQQMLTLLSSVEVKAQRMRARRMLQSKKYPLPGPGPNRPWPPI